MIYALKRLCCYVFGHKWVLVDHGGRFVACLRCEDGGDTRFGDRVMPNNTVHPADGVGKPTLHRNIKALSGQMLGYDFTTHPDDVTGGA